MEGFAYKKYREDGSYTWVLDDVTMTDLLDINSDHSVLFVDSIISTVSDKALMTAIDGLWEVIKAYIYTTTGLIAITNDVIIHKVFNFPEEDKDIDLSFFRVTPYSGLLDPLG